MGVLGCLLALILAFFDIESRIRSRKHSLNIFIPKTEIYNTEFHINLLLSNDGDYDEVISEISFYLVDQKNNHVQIASNDGVMMIDSKQNLNLQMVSDIDFDNEKFDLLINDNVTYSIIILFRIISYDSTFTTKKVPIGDIFFTRNSKNEKVGDVRFYSSRESVDFNKSKPQLILTNHPRTTEYDIFKIIIRKH